MQLFKINKVVFSFLILLIGELCLANPGDTTWVTVFNQKKLTYNGNFDTVANFPSGKRYRKIRLHYILGRYACPPTTVTPAYCGSWDYTTQIFARRKHRDSVEIARVITPYATDWLTQNKKHDWVIDVTDYATLLDSTVAMRFNYGGYSWGFTITLKLEFIEGVPVMDALKVKKVYEGYFQFGYANNPIENYLVPKTYSYNPTTPKVFLKNFVTGHGSDDNVNYCAEFCSKYYQLKVNNNLVSQKQLWRPCGLIQVYPQTGTWIYDRANWCPGADVWPIYHDLSDVTTPNNNFTVNVDMEPYVNATPGAGYHWGSHLLMYSAPNHNRDVSVEDIVAPTNDDNYLRNNPICSNPIIRIRNTGTDTLKNIVFIYGLKNGAPLSHTWTGSLAFLAETEVAFPPSTAMVTSSVSNVFTVEVVSVNGTNGDQDLFNNVYRSVTLPNIIYPKDFVIKMYTNNATDPNTSKNETSWKLFDGSGTLLKSRTGLANKTVYLDTVWNLPEGCYKFVIDDTGCDGMSFWANPTPGNGSIRFDINGVNSTVVFFPGDFGCNYTQYFMVTSSVGIKENIAVGKQLRLYPNPAGSKITLGFTGAGPKPVNYVFLDASGRAVKQGELDKDGIEQTIDTGGLGSGLYFISVKFGDNAEITKKVVLEK